MSILGEYKKFLGKYRKSGENRMNIYEHPRNHKTIQGRDRKFQGEYGRFPGKYKKTVRKYTKILGQYKNTS